MQLSNSIFKGTYKKTQIKGKVNLFASPFDDTGDLSLNITSNELDYSDALNLDHDPHTTNSLHVCKPLLVH